MVLGDCTEAVLRQITTTSSKISAPAGLLLINEWWALQLLPTNVWWEKSILFLMMWLYESSVLERVSGYIEIIDISFLVFLIIYDV